MRRTARMLMLAALVSASLMLQAGAAECGVRTDPMGGTGGGPIAGLLQVRVVHDGSTDPVAGAFVMVGPYPGQPFSGNWGFTSGAGEIAFSDPGLVGPVEVTAGAAGLSYFTLTSVDAAELVIPLKPVAPAGPVYEVGDFVSGIDVNDGLFHSGDGNVDMAFVVPTLRLEDLMSFAMENLIGPMEVIDILGEPFEIPSNIFLPQQWELFVEIVKDHYYLYLPPGDYTIAALSGRIPLDQVLGGTDIVDLIPFLDWREIDILNAVVSGNTYTADLTVDPDLTETVTLNLSNVPDGSTAWCISVGDLDGAGGLGRLAPLGLSLLECPAGSGPCGGTVSLTTTAATGEFSGTEYFPVTAVEFDASDDLLVVMDRAPRPQTYTAAIGTFFSPLDLSYGDLTFAWSDAESPGNGSPDVDLQMARIRSTDGTSTYWEFMIPGGTLAFEAPYLPDGAPPGPVGGNSYAWEHVALGLDYDLPSFDFDNFAFSDVAAHVSHLALDRTGITFEAPATDVASGGAARGAVLLGGRPNPFNPSTVIRLELAQATEVDLSIYTLDGRKVTTLANRAMSVGDHDVPWLARDASGRPLPSGVYLVRFVAEGTCDTRKLVLLK
jgi:hypothetical protein